MVNRLNCYKGQRAAVRGLTRVGVLAVLACVVGLMLLLLPALMRSKSRAIEFACEENLRQIGAAFQTWEGNHSNPISRARDTNTSGTFIFASESNSFANFLTSTNALPNPWPLNCPSDSRDGTPDFAHFTLENMSYFIALDADKIYPEMCLAGDRNLTTNGMEVVPGLVQLRANDQIGWSGKMHRYKGNLVLVDGSVQLSSTARLQSYLTQTGTNKIRLAVP